MTKNKPVMRYHQLQSQSFDGLRKTLTWLFLEHAHEVHTDRWQGWDITKKPEMRSRELMSVTTTVPLKGIEELAHWRNDVKPSLPWADDHFLERVCGAPINPGIEWANWPWSKSALAQLTEDGGQFNHNYMERYWPKYAGQVLIPTRTAEEWNGVGGTGVNFGIRNDYGDLMDLVVKLAEDPTTRQAWLPIFFPEDTGKSSRMPCTLGYQFIMRDGKLDVYYPLRSCDFVRHWADDVYLTIRLLLWIIEKARELSPIWRNVVPGQFTMHMTSLHVFMNDYRLIQHGG